MAGFRSILERFAQLTQPAPCPSFSLCCYIVSSGTVAAARSLLPAPLAHMQAVRAPQRPSLHGAGHTAQQRRGARRAGSVRVASYLEEAPVAPGAAPTTPKARVRDAWLPGPRAPPSRPAVRVLGSSAAAEHQAAASPFLAHSRRKQPPIASRLPMQAANQLDALRQMSKVVADTGEIGAIERYRPVDCTTNPRQAPARCSTSLLSKLRCCRR